MQEEINGKSSNLCLDEALTISVTLDSAYFIRRAGDTAFARTNYP